MTHLRQVAFSDVTEWFQYLDELRESGDTNMRAADLYMRRDFPQLTENEAESILFAWIKTHSFSASVEARATQAQAEFA